MRLEVHHATVYRYQRPVHFGQHRAMLRPRDSHDLKLRSAILAVSPPAEVRWVHDVFGNSITLLDFHDAATELRIDSWIEIEPFGLDQPTYDLAAAAETWPFTYDREDRRDLGLTRRRHYPDEHGKVRAWALGLLGRRKLGTLELLITLTREIKAGLTYAARDDEGTQEPLETLSKGTGTCRDYALLMMEAVRSLGFAARFVTGYLYDPALDGGPAGTQGAGATHAWVQVYLPGAGWVEFDPTNGIVGGRNLIRVGVARDPKQAIPLSGSFVGTLDDYLGMEVEVTVERLRGDD